MERDADDDSSSFCGQAAQPREATDEEPTDCPAATRARRGGRVVVGGGAAPSFHSTCAADGGGVAAPARRGQKAETATQHASTQLSQSADRPRAGTQRKTAVFLAHAQRCKTDRPTLLIVERRVRDSIRDPVEWPLPFRLRSPLTLCGSRSSSRLRATCKSWTSIKVGVAPAKQPSPRSDECTSSTETRLQSSSTRCASIWLPFAPGDHSGRPSFVDRTRAPLQADANIITDLSDFKAAGCEPIFLFYRDGARVGEVRGVNLPALGEFLFQQLGIQI